MATQGLPFNHKGTKLRVRLMTPDEVLTAKDLITYELDADPEKWDQYEYHTVSELCVGDLVSQHCKRIALRVNSKFW